MKKIIPVLIVSLLVTACSFSVTTANISKPGMTTGVSQGTPVDSITEYSADAPAFYAYGVLNNAPDDTTVTFIWKYLTKPQVIDEVSFNNEGQSGVYVVSDLTMDGMWPQGDYSVEIYIDDREEPDAKILFTVK